MTRSNWDFPGTRLRKNESICSVKSVGIVRPECSFVCTPLHMARAGCRSYTSRRKRAMLYNTRME